MFKKSKKFVCGNFKPIIANQSTKKINVDIDIDINIKSDFGLIENIHDLKDVILPKLNETNIFITEHFKSFVNILDQIDNVLSIKAIIATLDNKAVDVLNKFDNVELIARERNGEYLSKLEIERLNHKCSGADIHIKAMLIETENDYFVIECSGNMKSSANNEIVIIDNNYDYYKNYKDAFEQIKHKHQ